MAQRFRDKTVVIISTVRMIREDMGCRFLKQVGNSYVQLSEKECRAKVGHAFRDMAAHQNKPQRQQCIPKKKTKQSTTAPPSSKSKKKQITKLQYTPQQVYEKRQSYDLGRLDETIFGLEVESLDNLFAACDSAPGAMGEKDLLFDTPIPSNVRSTGAIQVMRHSFLGFDNLEIKDVESLDTWLGVACKEDSTNYALAGANQDHSQISSFFNNRRKRGVCSFISP